ncbi:MAG: FAD-dependent oxidoreductase [Anaerolineae bacterium]|nr:MAG: FAD-dependent oxidoreductase [Anaerolineae bacterium]WKZ43027.1 MAG: FAD-binding oxidoreductase [Anaerolineales bacterium]
MNQQIYWHTTVNMPGEEHATTPLPEKVDVAVIGGGFTGLSTARTLAKRNLKVVVLEAETIGWGASSRNGGMTLTGLKPSMQSVIKKYGRDLAKQLFQVSLDSVDTVEQVVKEEKIDCGFKRYGHLYVASKPHHFDSFYDEVDFMAKEFNHKVRVVPPNELRDEIGSAIYHGGIVDEVSGGLNPAQYVAGLARAAEKAGASLHARARVNSLTRRGTRFFIQTKRGNVEAESVLVGTSGYTGNVTKKLQRKIIPIGSFIIATEKLPDELARELSPKNRMIFDSMHYLNYFRLWDNRMIFGGRAAFFPENKNTITRSAEILRRGMIRVYPQLKEAKIEYVWGGTLDFAFDMMTHVGEMDGVYYSLGYAGHGVAMASHLGKTVAEAMLNGNIKEHPFAQFDFPGAPLGLYNGFPWFLPIAGAWQKVLDWVE